MLSPVTPGMTWQSGNDMTVMTDMVVMPHLIGHLIKQQLSAIDSFCAESFWYNVHLDEKSVISLLKCTAFVAFCSIFGGL